MLTQTIRLPFSNPRPGHTLYYTLAQQLQPVITAEQQKVFINRLKPGKKRFIAIVQ
jgi:hypothetical protein